MTKWFSGPLRTEPIDRTCGDHMTMAEFISAVECGCLIDYDGFGKYATADLETNIYVKPSDLKRNLLMKDTYTHVVWYNR